MPDRIRLDGRVAVVTGAAGVIGSATIRLLAERGARIVAVDRREADLGSAIRPLPASAQAVAVAADVTDEDDVKDYVGKAVEKFGTIDAFYNNAGVEGEVKSITNYSLEAFRRVLDVNVIGVFLGMKHVLPVMLKQDKGSIINTASIAGLLGSPHIAVYSASKHAVIGLTKSAAWECTGTGVRINCVCPGLIDSRMLSAIFQGRFGGNEPPPMDKIVERIPARRLGLAWRLRQLSHSLPPTKQATSPAPPIPSTAAARPREHLDQILRFSPYARGSRSRCRCRLQGVPGSRTSPL
jgi:NAD(P)-dependent dehydrogenase (short-subunit alcohol dehydrogenase family)